jgi:hypothetical protein
MTNEEALKVALAQMARSGMGNWQQFLTAYRAYSADLDTQLVTSPSTGIEHAQGRARQGRDFMRILDAALKDADLILNRKKT